MKTTLFLLMLLAASPVFSQRNGLSIEPITGYGSGNLGQAQNGGALKAGFGFVYMFNDHFGISWGIQFCTISSTYTSYSYDYSSFTQDIQKYTSSFLELPALFRYISSKDTKVGFFAEAGFNASLLLHTHVSETNTSGSASSFFLPSTSTSSSDIPDDMNSLSTLHLALGIFIPMSERCSFIINGEINQGIASNNGWESILGCIRLNIKLRSGSALKRQVVAPQTK